MERCVCVCVCVDMSTCAVQTNIACFRVECLDTRFSFQCQRPRSFEGLKSKVLLFLFFMSSVVAVACVLCVLVERYSTAAVLCEIKIRKQSEQHPLKVLVGAQDKSGWIWWDKRGPLNLGCLFVESTFLFGSKILIGRCGCGCILFLFADCLCEVGGHRHCFWKTLALVLFLFR
ncbi:hypothetical protein TPHA_0O00850 [Tetrapisispora phaffii CBS 4417]|uniref:Uncharacterized protein n=1 Tax=Tetrapisispora phaffii (strain ATCC 24235 / CBS 4417 / NBRC 1672 / NRRL Y-8282 / UCD 70-5) TaxID=1071381 RepID=G8C1M6_TETPH|nr:hypothetical protein TPHA_0O00850 [Tetrapisispora phaffii CBS 4417]CCE66054.1 hypothetical protein TPHA_0O00850 [Tetrapisispora phaffii CBS 4417]